jgi:hypothetical protein
MVYTDVSKLHLMMETIGTSKTSVSNHFTSCNNPKDETVYFNRDISFRSREVQTGLSLNSSRSSSDDEMIIFPVINPPPIFWLKGIANIL